MAVSLLDRGISERHLTVGIGFTHAEAADSAEVISQPEDEGNVKEDRSDQQLLNQVPTAAARPIMTSHYLLARRDATSLSRRLR